MPNLKIEILNVAVSLFCMIFIHRQTKTCGYMTDCIRQRIGLFDVLKGICVVGVVCIHAAYLAPASRNIYRTLEFAVPFFFVSSGFLLSVRCKGTIDLSEYYQKLFVRILLIYLIFVVGTRMFKGEEMTVKDIFLDITLGRTNFNYYFIPLILQFYILFPFIVKFREKLDSLVIFFLVTATSFFFIVCNHYIQHPYWNNSPLYMVFIGRDLAYFCFGIFLSRYDIGRLGFRNYLLSFLIFLSGTAVLILSSGEYRLTYAYPFAAFIFALVIYNGIRQHHWLRIIEDLGQYSLVIYLVHSTIQGNVVMKYFYNEKQPWSVQFLVVVGVTVILSYSFARLFMAVYRPVVAYIFPIRRREKSHGYNLDRQ
jgi:peptidoglycan/LPS O-acetylase OafA/YrhL